MKISPAADGTVLQPAPQRACVNCRRADRLSVHRYRRYWWVQCDCQSSGLAGEKLSEAVALWEMGVVTLSDGKRMLYPNGEIDA